MIYVIGIGPGCRDLMTQEAISAMEDAEVIVGYKTYIKLVEDFIKDKEVVQNGMRKEVDRCQDAIDIAKTGKKVAVISSGDAGIYGMAGLILELITKQELDIPVKVVPGVTASIGAAAVLGAPIMHDFCHISLSDLMTPWEVIEKRLRLAAEADFVICLYNPRSKGRSEHLANAFKIMGEFKDGSTPVGIVKDVGRADEEKFNCQLNDKKEKLPYNRVRTKRKHGQGGFLMSEKMLVTQALDERDLLVKMSNSKIAKASFVDTIKPNEEKVFAGNMKKEDYAKEAEAAFQQIMDLIDRYQKIDAAIVASNASTFVTTSYGTYSVAGAIALRNRLRGKGTYSGEADFEKTLADKMSGEYRARVRFCDDKNSVLQGSAEGMRLSILGSDAKSKDEKSMGVVEAYIKENTRELVDPLDVRKKLDALEEKQNKLLKELDTQIKVSNATSMIEIA